MRAVNLLPPIEQTRSFAEYRGVAFGAGGGVALVSVALAALMIGAGGAIQQRGAELDSLNAQLAALPPAPVDQEESTMNAALAFEKPSRCASVVALFLAMISAGQPARSPSWAIQSPS